MTATKAHYRRLESIINSLRDSTYLSVSLKGETVFFNGLNSPYSSHCSVQVEQGHGFSRLAVFRNRRAVLAITPRFPGGKFEGAFQTLDLPAYHLFPLFHFPLTRPDWVRDLIKVTFLDTFSRFDDDGKVIQKPLHEQYLLYKEEEDGLDLVIVPKLEYHSHKIGCKEIRYYPRKKIIFVGDREIHLGEEFEYKIPYQYDEEVEEMLHSWGLMFAHNCPDPCPGDKDDQACLTCKWNDKHVIVKQEETR
ncbi:MAG: hypothetical protein JRJ31_16995 [Deltaproteobacteria bacterium]|nr:hypothetical protein [Deltaproteobacteria bacterium]